jgi:MtN3 and saliva related transmembrane protein
MDATTLLGLAAAFFSTGSLVPQVVQTIRTRDTSSISLLMYLIFMVSIVLWLAYGILTDNIPITLCNAANLLLSAIILFYKLRYK